MYVYIHPEPAVWTVGFYDPTGTWISESDHAQRENAADRVHYLNGGSTQALYDTAERRNG